MFNDEAELQAALLTLACPGLLIACRHIAAEDGGGLWPEETEIFRNSVPKVRRQSGAARIVARDLMQRIGHGPAAIPRVRGGPPRWPDGLVGSLAHDAEFAVAALSTTIRCRGLGIDIEPAIPLPLGIETRVATPEEQLRYPPAVLSSRLLFVVKEAVYKAVNPIDGVPLGFQDVQVNLEAMTCRTTSGWEVGIRYITRPSICALAILSN
ncbi:4'-phosphopantetheinyl transferase family protein [Antarctobacter sp.]|uniref:4'-phosphopantetheinyl transferase family protein n=1 Tax=Antarctobacter sp. TaxID=1872577 RepID=UPI003A934A02